MVPARAGVILVSVSSQVDRDGGTRASGGDPGDSNADAYLEGWYPRERG